jgi:hypothetical protein
MDFGLLDLVSQTTNSYPVSSPFLTREKNNSYDGEAAGT